MMKVKIFNSCYFLWTYFLNAQSNLLNAKVQNKWVKSAAQLISDNDKPLAYGYVHDRDVLMGKSSLGSYRFK
jgi:hypothetical protein